MINISIKIERKLHFCIVSKEELKTCFHCQDECQEEIHFDDHVFCCTGCKTVYEILNGQEMDQYYSLDENPGIRPSGAIKGKFNYLDLEEFQEKLVFFKEGSTEMVRFFIPKIHCSSCLWLLERLHKLKPGIVQSQVDFVKKEVVITYNTDVTNLREVAELCATIGYPPKITLEDYDGRKKNRTNRKLIIQIGVAGFCFGNIMLISFPEYLGLNANDANFQRLFSWLNLILSLPVLIFGARDYLISAYKSIRTRHINIDVPISLGILALYSRSLYEILSHTGAGYMDSFAGLIFFLLVGKWFQHQTYTAINFERDYESYFPISVSRIVNGEEEIVALKQIKMGDRLVIRNNELIPTDAVLIQGDGHIDYSFVSGESALIHKRQGDALFAGGRQEGEAIEVEVLKEVENSYLTQLWNNPIFDKQKEAKNLSDTISRYFTFLLIGIALVAGIVWYFIDPSRFVFIVTSVLIVACPCAIALSVPFTYGNSIRIFGRKSFYLRSTQVIEPLTAVSSIVFDKTGTITEGNTASIHWEGEELTKEEWSAVASSVQHSSHPLSRAIDKYLKEKDRFETTDLKEIPGKGIQSFFGSDKWRIGSAHFVHAEQADNLTRVYVALNEKTLGSFVFANQYRPGMEALFKRLSRNHKLYILSGDNDAEKSALGEITPAGTQFQFNQKPEDKLAFIADLQSSGEKVMMLGDGLNDAGALRQSDVGMSVVDDVYAFSPASDGIISGDKLIKLDTYLNFAQYSKKVVMWSYVFSLLYNTVGMFFALSGTLTPLVAAILMPLSSISVVLFVTLLTNMKGRKLP